MHNNLGLLYQDRGRLDDAMKEFQQAIALDPKYMRAHNNFGVALLRAGRLDAATGELRVALAEEPRNVESIVNLALVHKAAGRAAEARDLLQRAVGVDPRNAGARYNLAVVADEAGDPALAVEHYRAFLRLGAVAHADFVTRRRPPESPVPGLGDDTGKQVGGSNGVFIEVLPFVRVDRFDTAVVRRSSTQRLGTMPEPIERKVRREPSKKTAG